MNPIPEHHSSHENLENVRASLDSNGPKEANATIPAFGSWPFVFNEFNYVSA